MIHFIKTQSIDRNLISHRNRSQNGWIETKTEETKMPDLQYTVKNDAERIENDFSIVIISCYAHHTNTSYKHHTFLLDILSRQICKSSNLRPSQLP